MDVSSPRVEVLSRGDIGTSYDAERDFRASRRRVRIWLVFLAVFLISNLLALGYVFQRPPVYLSTATLSITQPANVSTTDQTPQNVAAVQSHLLLGQSLLAQILVDLGADGQLIGSDIIDATGLRAMLDAKVVPETNMVVLEAHGPTPEVLPMILRSWVETYLDRYASARAQKAETSDTALEERLRGLEQKVSAKRSELARFREEHDIASMGREENQALARLKGLTESFNKASEEAVAAQSRLLAIEQALAQGRPVGQSRDEAALANMETRAAQLREELQSLQQLYTERYLSLDPGVRTLKEQIRKLEESIVTKRREMGEIARSQAEQDLLSARETMETIEKELSDYQQTAAAFTTRFSELESLQEELLQLETLQREAQAQMVQQEVTGDTLPPEVALLEQPSEPHQPVGPDYLRDALISVAGGAILALLAALGYALATRASAPERPVQTVVYSGAGLQSLPASEPRRLQSPPPLLGAETPTPRELSPGEVRAMLAVADSLTQPAICALVSGLSVDELLALRWGQVDLEGRRIEISGAVPRTLPVTEQAYAGLHKLAAGGASPSTPVWHDSNEGCLAREALDAMVAAAAYRANLDRAGGITAETFWHTYICFLVRQGLTLDALSAIVGPITREMSSRYRALELPGAGKGLGEVDLNYPIHA